MWTWLTDPPRPYNWFFVLRVAVKAALLFAVFNLLFAILTPLPTLGRISIYNWLVPGRERLPYGEDQSQSYNLTLNNLNAMFASHALAAPKANDEYRVVLIGDSSTWGFLLETDDTLAGQLNRAGHQTADGRRIRVYNIGYPTMSLTKDLLLLDYAMRYDPDMVIWLVTLESFPRSEQLEDIPTAQNNPEDVRDLIARYNLNLDSDDSRFVEHDFWGQTIIGQRRELANWLRLQLFGVMWATTGIDQHIPAEYDLRASDFDEDITWKTFNTPQSLGEDELVFDVVRAGALRVGDIPFLLVNEPMFISTGENSDLRYNFFYPRWAYDEYREQLAALVNEHEWDFLDTWDIIPPHEFTDSPVHMTPEGTRQLSEIITTEILKLAR